MDPHETPAEQPEGQSVDINRVMQSYQRQISEQAGRIAINDAIIETQREEIQTMRGIIEELSKAAPVAPSIPSRTTAKKKR